MDAKVKRKTVRKSVGSPFGYSMPHLSPLYTPPPYEYRDTHAMMVCFESDPRIVSKYVPQPLVPDPKGAMFAQISRFFTSGFGSYHEIILVALASFKGRPVNYALSLILDNDIAIANHARDVAMQAGYSHAMPPGNVTEITPQERALLVEWFREGSGQ